MEVASRPTQTEGRGGEGRRASRGPALAFERFERAWRRYRHWFAESAHLPRPSLLPKDFARAALVDIGLALPVRTADVNIVHFVIGQVGLRVHGNTAGLFVVGLRRQ